MSSDGPIDYEALVQEAMRGVLRAILQRVAKTGLPGEHHFYISFNTQSPGVGLSKRLKERYPEEMTVVLQHRFWDLIVHDDRFEVKLTFDSIPERLVVPFASVKVFVDPSVRFGHQFEDAQVGEDAADHPDSTSSGDVASMSGRRGGAKKRSTVSRKHRSDRPREGRDETNDSIGSHGGENAEAASSAKRTPTAPVLAQVPAPDHAPAAAGGKVVSLDKFRKK